MNDSVEAFLARLHHPALASVDLSLDRMHRLLAALGNPERKLPPVIHVAGTNGKGSLIANLHAIFQAAGYTPHRYISPHLVSFNERITLAGTPIADDHLLALLKHISATIQRHQATFFEATTALAFLAFADARADVLLLETGMGGRLDATNVIAKPVLTAITPIALDHTEYLGPTIEKIAAEKAGILKKEVPCIVGRQAPEALHVVEQKAAALGVPVARLGYEWYTRDGVYYSGNKTVTFTPALVGSHQQDNAATAIACIERLPQFKISDQHIRDGIASASWPARLQHLTQGKLAALMPQGVQLWLDGGHNPQGAEVLAQWLDMQREVQKILICGMLNGKDARGFFTPLAGKCERVVAITIPREPNARPAASVAEAVNACGIPAEATPSLEKALQIALAHAKTPAIICICGSLYLAGKVLALNG